jgi:hypothetical protein
MRDGVGMVGRIVFAWARGSRLDCDCKKWRLMADLLNDIAFAVDLLAGNVMSELFTPLVCISSLLRAVVGVAGAATRTAVVQHQVAPCLGAHCNSIPRLCVTTWPTCRRKTAVKRRS